MKKFVIVIIVIHFLLFLPGCVTVTPKNTMTMSDHFLCEMLGPWWVATPGEQQTIRDELNRRGVICDYGRVVGYREETQQQPATPPTKQEPTGQSTGTGFFINKDGYLITNNHVVTNCKKIQINNLKVGGEAKVLFADELNDLAIINSDSSNDNYAHFRGARGARTGEDIIAIGYPLSSILGQTVKVTKGNISSVTGIANDSSTMQITAPIQPGSSGGPLLDVSGNVVGIVSSKLNEIAVAKATGSLPQNINFAIKSQTMQVFLDTHEIDYKLRSSDIKLETADIADEAQDYTVRVTCFE